MGLLAGMEGPKDATTGETHPLDSSEAMMAGKFLTFWKQEDSQTKAIVIFFLRQKLQIKFVIQIQNLVVCEYHKFFVFFHYKKFYYMNISLLLRI